jgi:hypothetical protein
MRKRLQHLADQVGPQAVRTHLQGAFAQEAEEVLAALNTLAWHGPADDVYTIRAEQMLYACAERLAYLRRLQESASDGYVAYTARSLARDLDIVFYLLSPQNASP